MNEKYQATMIHGPTSTKRGTIWGNQGLTRKWCDILYVLYSVPTEKLIAAR